MKNPFSEVPEKEIYKAIREHLAWHTVGISCGTESWGTGVPVKYKDKRLLLTAGHVLEGHERSTIYFVARPDAELVSVPGEKAAKGSPLEKMKCQEALPVIKIQVIDVPVKDVGIILLDAAKADALRGLHFFNIDSLNRKAPLGEDVVALAGFAQQIASRTRTQNIVETRIRLYTEFPKMIDDPGNLINFDKSIHFLLRFPEEELAGGELLNDLHGISGCGVWKPIKNEPGKVWRINNHLIGLQIRVYESRIIKCTKIEVVLNELRKFLSAT
jgi:hypothetical protein